uniref:Neurochondrin n=1 Tax=Branchiostoma floridae TaxID=7739 RepID=C3XWM3_BRAFL|eukprot:XP_002611123.1 hypothetical protein BRAFLDRAFT_88480 [Branchiostoma floridae]
MAEMEVTATTGGEKRPALRTPSGSRERPHSVPSLDLDRCLQMLRQARSDSEQFAALLLVSLFVCLFVLDRCLQMLRQARSDSEQFAALLLVTKMVQAQQTDASTRRRIFDAVGFTFPNRLLKSAGGPEGDIYRALGVTIFSCFCTDSELVLHHHVTSKIPLFNDIIVEPPGDSPEDQTTHNSMVEDCYQCLLAIGATQPGRTQLIARDSVPVLCQAVIKKMYGYAQAMQIMRQLLVEHGRELWNKHGDALTQLLTAMAKEFTDADDISKFVLCEDLGLLLSGRDKDAGDFLHYNWAEDVLNGLLDILGSYIGPEQRNPALELASLMLDHLGIEWAMSCNVKFVLLLVNLACVEVRMVLEDPDIKQVFLKSSLMSACYNILESAIMFASVTPDLPLDPKQIEQFVESLQGAYVGVTFFLAQVAQQPQDTVVRLESSVQLLETFLKQI